MDIEHALATGRVDEIDHAVDEVLARLREGNDAGEALDGCHALESDRRFEALLKLADGASRLADAERAWDLRELTVAALIELDARFSADRLLRALLDDAGTGPHRGALLARLGRLEKDRYVESGDPTSLEAAIRAYAEAYAAGVDPLWVGVNAIALRALAARRGLPPDDAPAIDVGALLATAVSAPLPRGAWSLATEFELRMARGEPSTALVPLVTQLMDAPDATGFVFASLARQLHEIWDVDPADPVMAMLGERTLADGRGEVILPKGPEGYERLFGSDFPVPIELYRKGLDCAQSVGSLLVRDAFCMGTTFVMRGADLHPSLADRVVLVTNEHVVPDPARGENPPQPGEFTAHFDGVPGDDGGALSFGGLRAIWRSPREELDITLLLTDDPATGTLKGLDLAPSVPPVRDGAYVYVIGHPGGAGLQLSIRGNDLVDEDDIRLRYKAPTEKGSSGSPVFDDAWKLIGVHHKGSVDMQALNGAAGTYAANEGITLHAIRDELTRRPPEL
jgi:hypothetical protein